MGNGHHKHYHIEEATIVPEIYEMNDGEKAIFRLVKIKVDIENENRKQVYYRGKHIGLVQIGFGYEESYAWKLKKRSNKGDITFGKLYKPLNFVILHMVNQSLKG